MEPAPAIDEAEFINPSGVSHDGLDPRAAGSCRFRGKVCIVTGAGQGIGRATARRLGAEGATVVVAERVAETARETVDILESHGVPCRLAVADVSRLAEVERLMQDTVDAFGRIDVLVNVVGGTIWWQPFGRYSEEQILLELERSLHTTLWCCRAVLPHMIRQGTGAIVNISSSVTQGDLFRAPYAASKGGVDALTRTLASENGRHGIRVNAVAPGNTVIPDRVTPRSAIGAGQIAEAVEDSEAFYQETRTAKFRPIARPGLPEEQAAVVAFLASDDASYITGEIVTCNGGA